MKTRGLEPLIMLDADPELGVNPELLDFSYQTRGTGL
jgi:hypothetical protein